MVPTVKDKHLPHHSNLSGSAYVYLIESRRKSEAYSILSDVEGVERVLTSDSASEYHLPRDRVGDLFVLAEERYVFGSINSVGSVRDVLIRSHGSLHKQEVPIMVYGVEVPREQIKVNKDLTTFISDWLGMGSRSTHKV